MTELSFKTIATLLKNNLICEETLLSLTQKNLPLVVMIQVAGNKTVWSENVEPAKTVELRSFLLPTHKFLSTQNKQILTTYI